jgi:rhodanese-related sulfurtransferase
MKNLFKTLVLALALMLTLTGCASDTEEVTVEPTAEPVEETAEPVVEEANVMAVAVDAFYAELEANYQISTEDLFAKIDADEDMTILSIRSADDYATGHVVGAYNAAWPTGITEAVEYLPMSKPVYVYCYSGQTAGQAVATLRLLGFNAISVKYGFNFGISKTEGYEAYVSTEAAEFEQPTGIEFDAELLTSVSDYYDGLVAVSDTEYKNYKISEDAAKEKLDAEDSSVMFVSIRQESAYAEGHIAGAINIPYGTTMSAAVFTEQLPMDKTIIVYCYSGQTAGQTVATMRLLGYDAVSLNGGMGTEGNAPMGWANKGYEVVK